MRRAAGDRGAAAVEFALVATVLFPLLFALVDYGVYFADVIAVQRSAGEIARAVTLSADGPTGTGGLDATGVAGCTRAGSPVPDPLQLAACTAAGRTRTLTGAVHARARSLDAAGGPLLDWGTGGTLRLCLVSVHPPILPLIPFPDGGRIEARVDMPVEPQGVVRLAASTATDAGGGTVDWQSCDD